MYTAIVAGRQNAYKYSKFRRSFHLDFNDKQYIKEHGFLKLEEDAYRILSNRLEVTPLNDGQQTPYYGNPIFKAQHATACCCRKCVQKWHSIPRYKQLNQEDLRQLVGRVMLWIRKEMMNPA